MRDQKPRSTKSLIPSLIAYAAATFFVGLAAGLRIWWLMVVFLAIDLTICYAWHWEAVNQWFQDESGRNLWGHSWMWLVAAAAVLSGLNLSLLLN